MFDLSVVGYVKVGGKIIATNYQSYTRLNTLQGRRNNIKLDYWTHDNPTNAFPYPNEFNEVITYGSTLGYFDATFFKIRSINFGVTLPEKWISKAGISMLRLYVTAQNPFKPFFSPFVDQGGLDPEPNQRGQTPSGSGVGQRLTVGADIPPTRTFLFGVNLNF
jgi:hypothetical protein